jgi:rod shape determining protein RodA
MALAASSGEPVLLLQRERALRPDLLLILPYLALSGLGIVMIYSASAPRLEALGQDPASVMRDQAIFVAIGIVVFIAASLLDHRTLRLLAPAAYLISLLSLVVVLFAPERAGTHRWIQIGPLTIQPSEFAKVAVILALAALLASAIDRTLRWDHIARAVAIVGVPAALIFKQPDLGTMLVFGFIAVVMLFVGGTTWRQLTALVLAATVGAVGLFQVGWIEQFQLTRLTAFLDPAAHSAQTALYNQLQSEIAIGSGGFLGKGLFGGTQTNLSFVPQQATDFIFTAVGEQLGFVGATIVLGLFAVIVWRLLVAAANGRDRFSQLVAVGVAAMMVFHIFINVAMTMRWMPVTGLPLPFLSAGGTVYISMSLALGLAHSVWMRRSPVPSESQLGR